MALRNVLLSDTFSDIVTDVDGLCSDVGDLTLLTTSTKASVVAAVNEIKSSTKDSASVVTISRASVSVTDAGGDGSLSYSPATGIITYTGPSSTEVRAHLSNGSRLSYSSGVFNVADAGIDSAALGALSVSAAKLQSNAVTFDKMADSAVGTSELRNGAVTSVKLATGAVSSTQLASTVTLIIYNSAGAAVKTLYGAGA